MENIVKELDNLIEKNVELTLKNSETYLEALKKIKQNSGQTAHDIAIKKAIQDEIKKRALNSKIN
ncbi:hypothetical protein [Lactococcus garvieae]|uniref:hypothetical protein n=1 Tax=Lactococcus garvieae TaxID=1363 RepID=UPI0038536FB7